MEALEERFVKAVEVLATGPGSVQERVDSAWTELIALKRDDFPPELQPYFEVIESEMLRAPEEVELMGRDPAVAVAAAGRIFELALLVWKVR